MAGLLPSILLCGFFDAIQSPSGKLLKALGCAHREVAISSRIREVHYILPIQADLHRLGRSESLQAVRLSHARRVGEAGSRIGHMLAPLLAAMPGRWPGKEWKKTASGGNWANIGSRPGHKTEIPASNGCMNLDAYRKKRQFGVTKEPRGADDARTEDGSLIYAVQKHMASRLHYDFRLEWRGVLLSWAVPKGPSLDPAVKRLAVLTEDHPVEYAEFEGVIPNGQYGAGTVMLWDRGTWHPEDPDVDSFLQKGEIKFTLQGKKLKGAWVMVRTRGFGKVPDGSTWLLIKHRDQYASAKDVTQEEPRSVTSRRLLAEIARDDGGDVERASRGDPSGKGRNTARAKPAPGNVKRGRRPF
jgi:DNA ligase D-like protein (predicted 3'-phosphoesterase)